MKGALPVLLTLLLAACAASPAQAPWQRWRCDNGSHFDIRPSAEQLELRLDGGRIYRLTQEPAASGTLYSDGELALHSKGKQGLIYWVADDDLLGRNCAP